MFRVIKGNSMTRNEIIDVFVVRAAPAGRQELRQQLEKMSKEELEQAHRALISNQEIEAKEEELLRTQAEIAAERELFRLSREPQRKAEEKVQLEQDRATFNTAARTLRGFGLNEANFSVIRSTLGPNFTTYSIQQALASNALSLSPPTQEELDEWTRQDIKAQNTALLNADIPTLRRLTREAGARGQAPVAPDETQRVRQAERIDGTTYPILPDEFRDGNGPEQVLDAKFIRNCSKETLKFLFKRFGSAQVEEALRTRRSDASPLW